MSFDCEVNSDVDKQWRKALQDCNEEFEQVLVDQACAHEMILMDFEKEKKLLIQRILDTKRESIDVQQKALQAKELVLTNIVDVIEQNLQCCICREFIMEATVLNCSHVFCKTCIEQWMQVKKSCPCCRTQITVPIRITLIDDCITSLIEVLGGDIKKNRTVALRQRQAQNAELKMGAGLFTIFMSFLRVNGCTVDVNAALRQAAMQAQILLNTGSVVLKKTVMHTNTFIQTGMVSAQHHLKTAAAYAGKEMHSKSQQFYKSAVYRQALALARTSKNEISKSTIFRKAAAFTRAIALQVGKVKSKCLQNAATIAKNVESSETVKRVTELLMTFAKESQKHPTVKKAMMLLEAAMTRGYNLNENDIVHAINSLKVTAVKKVENAKRMSMQLRASTTARLETLRTSLATRSIACIRNNYYTRSTAARPARTTRSSRFLTSGYYKNSSWRCGSVR